MVHGDWEVGSHHGQQVLTLSSHPGDVVTVLGVTTLCPCACPPVLPKFEVTIHLPSVLWQKDEKFAAQICGR